MDIRPLIALLTSEGHLHGFTHTFIGANLLSVLSCVSGKYLGEFGLRLLSFSSPSHLSISWPIAAISSVVGCYSHLLLDALMHSDLQPWWPMALENPMLGLISTTTLHQASVCAGLVGAVGFFVIHYWQKNRRTRR